VSELGETLRTARQKRNLTLAEAAEATRIKSHFLEALEDGNYSVLPGPAYITGFLRNYARFLGLHPEEAVEEFYASRPMPVPGVKPATRVLASGFERQTRKRILWAMTIVAGLLIAGYTIKYYSDRTASAAPLPITPSNIGGQITKPPKQPPPSIVSLQVRAIQPAYVRVKVDGVPRFDGTLRPRAGRKMWTGHHTVYIATFNGSNLMVRLPGHRWSVMASAPGLAVDEATPSGLKPVL